MPDGPNMILLPALEGGAEDGNGKLLAAVVLPCVGWTVSGELFVVGTIMGGRPPLDELPPETVLCSRPLLSLPDPDCDALSDAEVCPTPIVVDPMDWLTDALGELLADEVPGAACELVWPPVGVTEESPVVLWAVEAVD